MSDDKTNMTAAQYAAWWTAHMKTSSVQEMKGPEYDVWREKVGRELYAEYLPEVKPPCARSAGHPDSVRVSSVRYTPEREAKNP